MSSTDLPPVPRLPTRASSTARRAPRERALSREAIAQAALRIVDAEGLDAMTMRRVGQELGTGAASLYAHVAGKEELLELVIDRVIGEVQFPPDAEGVSWQEQIKEGLRAIRRAFAAHRDLARASFSRIPLGENALRGAEAMLATLRRAGVPDRVAAYAADLLALYPTAIAYEESLYAAEAPSPEQMARYLEDLGRYFASVPADRFPNVVALAGLLAAGDPEERFEFGLEVLVRGLAAMGDWSG